VSRYFIRLAYKGTAYQGWQVQPHTPLTVQQQLNEKLSMLLRESIEVVGCGRTDSGVHARDYFAHFDSAINPNEQKDFIYHLNAVLPKDIAAKEVTLMPENAHARFDAISRTYEYHLLVGKDAFNDHQAWEVREVPDVMAMNTAADYLTQCDDFAAFCKAGADNKTTKCKLTEAWWMQHGNYLVFTITADRFLRNMVRAIVGTLMDVGRGKLTLHDVEQIVASGDRSEAGQSVPAHGLYLTRVLYPIQYNVNKEDLG
jgi:tRNA pseudouridine38-40 synthase